MRVPWWLVVVVGCSGSASAPVADQGPARAPDAESKLSVLVVGVRGCIVTAGADVASASIIGTAPVLDEQLPLGSRVISVRCPEGSVQAPVRVGAKNHMKLIVKRDMLH